MTGISVVPIKVPIRLPVYLPIYLPSELVVRDVECVD